MSAPSDPQQLDISAIAAEMERDPLSKALWENAQLRVMVRNMGDQNRALLDRVAELEQQKAPAGGS